MDELAAAILEPVVEIIFELFGEMVDAVVFAAFGELLSSVIPWRRRTMAPTLGHYLNTGDGVGSEMLAAPCSRGSLTPTEPRPQEAADSQLFTSALRADDGPKCVEFTVSVCCLLAGLIRLMLSAVRAGLWSA